MTKSELRRARKEARANGQPLTGDLALPNQPESKAAQYQSGISRIITRTRNRNASRAEQHARYIDCGPSNWDDR